MTIKHVLPRHGSVFRFATRRLFAGAIVAIVVLSGIATPMVSQASSPTAHVTHAGTAASLAGLAATAPHISVPSIPGLSAATGSKLILAATTPIGNSGPYVGPAGAIRGIQAGGAPWKVSTAVALLSTTGQLTVYVKDLTLLNNVNPVPMFEGAVSCQSVDSTGHADVANVFTGNFPASSSGQSVISATVTLPKPCFAPIIFVTSPGPNQAWFATTGA